jgi:succinate dehydrogenase flavin-adding protein (antitoxin of CptAB toxin-antitoxin module)
MNIDYANDIQKIFDRIMKKTDNDVFNLIIDRVNNNQLKLTNNLITNNEVNLYETNTIILKTPFKYPIKL